jgi:hypothetical protein
MGNDLALGNPILFLLSAPSFFFCIFFFTLGFEDIEIEHFYEEFIQKDTFFIKGS